MKFKYSAFTENTPEMREWLERLGYIPLKFFLNGKYIITKFCIRATAKSEWIESYFESINNARDACTSIDCRSNPQLFKAITAMREDSDYMQWFTGGNFSWLFTHKDSREIFGHKATLEELQEHFK